MQKIKRKPRWCPTKNIKCGKCLYCQKCKWTRLTPLAQEKELSIHKTLDEFK